MCELGLAVLEDAIPPFFGDPTLDVFFLHPFELRLKTASLACRVPGPASASVFFDITKPEIIDRERSQHRFDLLVWLIRPP